MPDKLDDLSERITELLSAGRTAAAAGLARDLPEESLARCGRAFFAAGDYATAVECFERALRGAATGGAAVMNDLLGWLGLASREAGDTERVASIRESTRREDPDSSVGLRLFAAGCLAHESQPDEAARLYDAGLATSDNAADQAWILLERGRWLHQRGKYEAATQDFRRAERLAGLIGDRLLLAWCRRAASGTSIVSRQKEIGSPRLYIRLLGQFRVTRGGEALNDGDWPRRKAALLLQYLALQPHWRAPKERVIELLWGDESDANAFYVTIHALRRGLSAGLPVAVPYLQVADGVVALDASLVAGSDVQEFRACIQAARTYWEDDREASLRSYRQARAVYAGELLAGVDAPWAMPVREMLSSMYVESLTRLAQASDREGLGLWLEALELEPANVEALKQTVSMLAAVGRKKQAIDLYLRYEAYVKRELGLEPAPALEGLFRQLKGEGRGLLR